MGIFDEDIEKGYASEIQIFFESEWGFKDFAFPSMRMGLLPSLFCLKNYCCNYVCQTWPVNTTFLALKAPFRNNMVLIELIFHVVPCCIISILI